MRLLMGPAGSGKTFRCLNEIRDALMESPEGPELVMVAPKQTTYQLERQLLADSSLVGYARLHILSFERLAYLVSQRLALPMPRMLDEQGRLMVLRSILAKRKDDLKLFRASARLTGFAQQLSIALGELQRTGLTPESLNKLAQKAGPVPGLASKLQDLATLLQDYLNWLNANKLLDADSLLSATTLALLASRTEQKEGSKSKAQAASSQKESATPGLPGILEAAEVETAALRVKSGQRASERRSLVPGASSSRASASQPLFARLWVDGFAELSEQEIELLAAVLPRCGEATVTFCLDQTPLEKLSWISNWSIARRAFERCRNALAEVSNVDLVTEVIWRDTNRSRFTGNPVLEHLERHWADPQPYRGSAQRAASPDGELPPETRTPACTLSTEGLAETLKVVMCADPEAEAILSAREILRHVRTGGRFRDVTVLVRNLSGYHDSLQRVFSRYQIPFFMDRREPASHHPLPELTRNTLRTIHFGWLHDDWFAALKTGLVPATEPEIDRLENEALARGWRGSIWHKPITISQQPELSAWVGALQARVLPPFEKLAAALGGEQKRITGRQFAAALRQFWEDLKIEQRLQDWAESQLIDLDDGTGGAIHETVWEEMNALLENVELAFYEESISLREWLQILEAGLASLSVGLIPPALDQVLIGTVERSRNPEVKLGLLLGLNEGVFPALPASSVLLTEADHAELEKHDISLNISARQQLGRERFLAYLGFTRSSSRLVLTAALQDANGSPLNPSPFLSQLRRMFPALEFESRPRRLDWRESEHTSELVEPLLRLSNLAAGSNGGNAGPLALPSAPLAELGKLPAIQALFERLRHFPPSRPDEPLSPDLAGRLYGPILRTSVSRMEQFAACPFRFFIHSGLKAEERKLFELDIKEQGTFQHDLLALFHERLTNEKKRWRDVTPQEARALIAQLSLELAPAYRDGLLYVSEQSRFMVRMMTESLQDFVETIVTWMRRQYQFDPVAVELEFGDAPDTVAGWKLDLNNGHFLALQGRIDRIDLHRKSPGETHCIVLDYKTAAHELDPVLLANGLQLQLLTYLNVVRRAGNALWNLGGSQLIPAGVFYVSLRGRYTREPNRLAALTDIDAARQLAYRHSGRFNAEALRLLDSRPDAREGDQFNYRITDSGNIYKNCREVLSGAQMESLLDSLEVNLKDMGRRIYAGVAAVDPYRKGSATACQQCGYRGICRIDPWTHRYRLLKSQPHGAV